MVNFVAFISVLHPGRLVAYMSQFVTGSVKFGNPEATHDLNLEKCPDNENDRSQNNSKIRNLDQSTNVEGIQGANISDESSPQHDILKENTESSRMSIKYYSHPSRRNAGKLRMGTYSLLQHEDTKETDSDDVLYIRATVGAQGNARARHLSATNKHSNTAPLLKNSEQSWKPYAYIVNPTIANLAEILRN